MTDWLATADWLADAYANYGIVESTPPLRLAELLDTDGSDPDPDNVTSPPTIERVAGVDGDSLAARWFDVLGCAELRLDYEVRSLLVLPGGTRVLAGTKAGTLYCLDWCPLERTWKQRTLCVPWPDGRKHAVRAIASKSDGTIALGGGAGMLVLLSARLSVLAQLSPDRQTAGGKSIPLRFTSLANSGRMFFGTTRGEHVHLFDGAGESVRPVPIFELFAGWDASFGRPVQFWDGGRVCVTSKAHIMCLAWESLQATVLSRPSLKHIDSSTETRTGRGLTVRRADKCGPLVVLVSDDYVGFLNSDKWGDVKWHSCPGVVDVSAVAPFRDEREAGRFRVAAANDSPGLIWFQVWLSDDGIELVHQAQHLRAGCSASTVHRVSLHSSAHGPSLMVTASRGNHIKISSWVDTKWCEGTLQRTYLSEMRIARLADAEFEQFRNASTGRAFVLLRAILDASLAVETSGTNSLGALLPSAFGRLGETEVIRLAHRTASRTRADGPASDERRERLRAWCLELLQCAATLDVQDQVADILHRGFTESPYPGLARLMLKWFRMARTYSPRAERIAELVVANREGDRPLDALYYQTALLRSRASINWSTRPKSYRRHVVPLSSLALPRLGLSLAGFSDGGVYAFGDRGNALNWEFSPTRRRSVSPGTAAAGLPNAEESLSSELLIRGAWLGSSAAAALHKVHRTGPALRGPVDLGESVRGAALIAFVCQESAEDSHGYAGLARAKGSRIFVVEIEYATGDTVFVRSVRSVYLAGDIESVAARPGSEVPSLLLGTAGVWATAGDTEPSTRETPFVVASVRDAHIVVECPFFSLRAAGRRSLASNPEGAARPEALRNAVLSVECSSFDDGFVDCGFEDGTIRRYVRDEHAIWHESLVFSTHSAIAGLAAVRVAGSFEGVVAAGTSDGSLLLLRPVRQDATGPFTESRLSAVFVGSEASGVCAVHVVDTPELGLAVVWATTGGRAVILRVAELLHPSAGLANKVVRDGFELVSGCRALDVTVQEGSVSLLYATPDSQLVSSRVMCVRGAASFTDGLKDADELLAHAQTLQILPADQNTACAWLRTLPVGSSALKRFAISLQLFVAGQALLPEVERVLGLPNGVGWNEAARTPFLRLEHLIKSLADEEYRHRHPTLDGTLMIWAEGARVANRMAHRALVSGPEYAVRTVLSRVSSLTELLDEICERWFTVPEVDTTEVLLQSFVRLFDWTDIWVLAADLGAGSEYAGYREVVLEKLVEPRLGSNNARLVVETLAEINRAMRGSIRRTLAQSQAGGRTKALRPRPRLQKGDSPVGFYDLVLLVGDAAERMHSSTAASEIYELVASFFAFSLVLVPIAPCALAQVASESRLVDRHPRFGREVADRVADCVADLGDSVELSWAERRLAGADAFHAWCFPGHWSETLTPRRAGHEVALRNTGDATERRVRDGQKTLQTLVTLLAGLEERNELAIGEALKLLQLNQYFRHSFHYLRDRIVPLRSELFDALSFRRGNALPGALVGARAERRRLQTERALYDPERTRYRSLVSSWIAHVESKGADALGMLDVLQQFNRHVYRASADELSAHVAELAARFAPTLPSHHHGTASDSPEALQRLSHADPLLGALGLSAQRLVDNTRQAGMLFSIAEKRVSDILGGSESGPRMRLDDLTRTLLRSGRAIGLRVNLQAGFGREQKKGAGFVPGYAVVWETVIREWCRNVTKYGSERGSDPSVEFNLKIIDGRFSLWSSGSRAFLDSLGAVAQRIVDEDGNLRRLASSIGQPGIQLARRTVGGGFGMFLSAQLLEASGVSLETCLGWCDRMDLASKDEESTAPLSLVCSGPYYCEVQRG